MQHMLTTELCQHRSTTGYGCCLAGGVVACWSRAQSVCAQSSKEAKLIAAIATQTEPTPIYEVNNSTIKIVNHNHPTDHSRHVKIRYFAPQHWRLVKDIILICLPGVVNPADMLTKALG